VQITERRYVDGRGNPVMVGGCQMTSVHVDTLVLEKDIVFTVDAVRPASGTMEYSAEFTKQQYFKSFNSKVEDKTIESITNSITAITGSIEKLPKASPRSAVGGPDEAQLSYVEHVVAVQVFDVYDPGLEPCVREFLTKHINACAPPCTPPGHCKP
jgi:hypothetical protein